MAHPGTAAAKRPSAPVILWSQPVPRYHFNVEDGHSTIDEVGTELPNLTAARQEAVRAAGALIAEHAGRFWETAEWKVVVTDDKGLVLFTLHFFATDGAAA